MRSGDRVLEVAVGTGAVIARLCELAGPQGVVIGVDIAPQMLSVARRRARGAVLVGADARALPFAICSFDLLWSSYFLDLIPNAELPSVLLEFRKVSRPEILFSVRRILAKHRAGVERIARDSLCADIIFHLMSSGVKVSPRLMASWIGRGGPVFGTVTCTHSSSPARRKEGSTACSGRKKATGSISAVTSPPWLIVQRLT